MNTLVTLLLFLLLLSIIIVIHELGHLLAAKLFHVYCYEFSFGMGPVLLQKRGKETRYSLRALPLGGFVAMAGESDGDALYDDTVEDERRIINIVWYKKVIIQLAGVFMNFLLAWGILSMICLSLGSYQKPAKPIISQVVENSVAEKAGLKANDEIVSVTKEDGTTLKPKTFEDYAYFIDNQQETLTVLRDGETLTITLTPQKSEDGYKIGIVSVAGEIVKVNFFNAWYYGAIRFFNIMSLMLATIAGLFKGIGLNNLSGPVGIYKATETFVSYGFGSYMFLIAQISMNVGIFNLLPLPILDGGQVIISVGEAIFKKTMNEKIKLRIFLACWILMIALLILVTWRDIVNLL